MTAEVAQMKPKANGAAKEPSVARPGPRWRVREAAKNVFVCLVDADVTTADLKRPGFFDLVSKDLRTRDDIEVHSLDGRKRWLFQVLDAGIGWAQVHLLQEFDLPAVSMVDRDILDGFELVQDGASRNWYAVRKLDRTELGRQGQLKSKKDLIRFIEDHASVRAR